MMATFLCSLENVIWNQRQLMSTLPSSNLSPINHSPSTSSLVPDRSEIHALVTQGLQYIYFYLNCYWSVFLRNRRRRLIRRFKALAELVCDGEDLKKYLDMDEKTIQMKTGSEKIADLLDLWESEINHKQFLSPGQTCTELSHPVNFLCQETPSEFPEKICGVFA